MKRLPQIAVGCLAAVRTPFWIHGPRLETLLTGPADSHQRSGSPGVAIRVSRLALRMLGRLPLLPWRNTCLYRSVAECLVLRSYGIGCRLQVGVKRASSAPDSIDAHAWVLRDGEDLGSASHTLLRPSP
jgi:hypothetical protein